MTVRACGSRRGQNRVMSREPHSYLRGELVVVIDCSDLGRSAEFWAGALGYVRDGTATGRYQSLLPADGKGAEVLLQRVPEGKRGKNRVHLDLRTASLSPSCDGLLAWVPRSGRGSRSARLDGTGTSWPIPMAMSFACCSHRIRTGQISDSPSQPGRRRCSVACGKYAAVVVRVWRGRWVYVPCIRPALGYQSGCGAPSAFGRRCSWVA